MKITKILLGGIVAAVVASCSSGDMESRLTKLEGRVAALEGKGGVATTANRAQPIAASNTSAYPLILLLVITGL